MRSLVLMLMLASLAGCADYDLGAMVPPPEEGTNQTVAPPAPPGNASLVPGDPQPAPPAYPVADAVATAAFTAPAEVALHRMEGDASTLLLVADAHGLRCVSVPHIDPLASPAGHRADSSWARCSLSVDGETHSTVESGSMAADMPLLRGIPVEPFTWNMSVGQVLTNNTGQHDHVRDEVSQDVSAAPEVHVRHTLEQRGVRTYSHQVCDTILKRGLATVQFAAEAHNGRAELAVDLAGYDAWEIEGSGTEVDAANATRNGTQAIWWRNGTTLHALGAWEHASHAQLTMQVYFHGDGGSVSFLPPRDCPDALFRDRQGLEFEARSVGVAAGWQEDVHGHMRVDVWHTW